MKQLLLSLLFSIAFFSSGFAQKKEQIIQLSSQTVLVDFEKGIQTTTPSFQREKTLCPDLNIHLYSWYEEERVHTLDYIKQSPFVLETQSNKKLSYRNQPNDPLFEEQWPLFNKGAQGILDADIDIVEAWKTTTGGNTINGDTIVVAVIDGGLNLEHPDLQNNIWVNRQEIPNNGLDDDANGYIDDYYGWNFDDNNNDISNQERGNWHGTPVAGIIGADGNNGIGMTGINWQVKLMNLVNGNEEADVLAAYDYILQMRKRYNETNGKEGAFVVVTNASWGIDYGKAADAPMWCAMYDLLGEQGILSVGATSNRWINVDEEGDLPTSCASPYLISVTNSNRYDEFDFAGYGKEHIDLSAPGAGTPALANDGTYSRFAGTSAAAPHVAGTIALLYSAPIEALGEEIKLNPEQAAKRVKVSIINGVDKLPSLENIIRTGGRLNVYNSLQKLHEYYRTASPNVALASFIDQVYPNPAYDFINIRFNINNADVLLDQHPKLHLIVYNSNFQVMYSQYYTTIDEGTHEQKIDLSNWSDGIYYIRAYSGDYLFGTKFVVMP